MSEQQHAPIRWAELSDKDKVRLLLERVMGYFVLEETVKGYSTPDLPKRAQAPAGFHWPIAFWNTDCDCWAYKDIADNGATLFHPLHSMDDVKVVRQHMAQRDALLNLHLIVYAYNRCYASFSLEPPEDSEDWSEGNGEYCMEEAICIAALRVVGVETA